MLDWFQSSPPLPVVQHENIQDILEKKHKNKREEHYTNCSVWLIHVMPAFEESCLIAHTLTSMKEEIIMNGILEEGTMKAQTVVIYGKNAQDYEKLQKKYSQMLNLGFKRVFVYLGGMFEWALLQQIHGAEQYPTTQPILDITEFQIPKRQL